MSINHARSASYRPEIDGLRALAVMPVLITHAGFQFLPGGFFGVDVFFVISGFLITSILMHEVQTQTFSAWGFYERRARRILPALYLVLAVSFVVAWIVFLPWDFKEFGQSLVATTGFFANVHFARSLDYFATSSEFIPLLHTWSLSVEEQFYLVFPLLLLLLRIYCWRALPLILIALISASLAVAQYGAWNFPQANFFSPFGRAWELLAGSLAAYWRPCETWLRGPARKWVEALSLSALAMIVGAYVLLDKSTRNPALPTLLPVLGATGVLLFSVPGTLAFRLLSSRPVVFVGLISYSTYLWHQPLFVFARAVFINISPVGWLGLIGLTLGLAWTSWRIVEQPFRNRNTIRRKAVFAFAGLGGVVFIGLGLALHVSHGLPARLDAAARPLANGQFDFSPMRDSCGNVMPDNFTSFCILGKADQASPIVAYLSDSHGKEIFWRLSNLLKSKPNINLRLQPLQWNACLPFASVKLHSNPSCDMFHERMRDYLIGSTNVRTLIIGANWENYFRCEPSAPHKRGINCSGFEKVISDIVAEVTAYRRAGKQIIIVDQIPMMPWDVPRHLQALRLNAMDWQNLSAIPSVPQSADFQRRLLMSKLAEITGVQIFHPADFLCPAHLGGACLVSVNARPMYFDHGHISGVGADKFSPILLDAARVATLP